MKILVVSPKNKTVFNFRGDLIKDMISKGHEVSVVGPNRDYVEDILALGVREFFLIKMVKDNTSVFGDLHYLKQLIALIKTYKPDLMFAYTIKPVIYGSIAAKLTGVKSIYAMVTGLGRVYASGGLLLILSQSVLPYILPDAVKFLLAFSLSGRLKKLLPA